MRDHAPITHLPTQASAAPWRVVSWRGVFRVIDDAKNAVAAVCETFDEATAYVAAQGGSP
jgi:hypothetical protein